jgi:benzoate-CoA ligase
VVAIENDDGLARMTLFLVPEEDVRPYQRERLEQRVRDVLQSTLSIYKCPRNIRFIEAIPRTATGKMQRFRLRQMASA